MGRPAGSPNKDKPFREALRVELAAAGENFKALRTIARNLVEMAQKPEITALPAIREIADRLDGKPVQSVEVGEPGDFDNLSDSELVTAIASEATRLGLAVGKKASGTKH